MKKILTSLIGVMSVVAVANAEPYVGLNLIYDNLSFAQEHGDENESIYDFLNRNQFGASINAGYQLNKYVGAEAYFQYNLKSSADIAVDGEKVWDSDNNILSSGIDIMGYLPLNSCNTLSLIGTIGGGYYHFEAKNTRIDEDTDKKVNETYNEDHIALRMGAGVQYNISETMSVRALGRYIAPKHDSDDVMRDMFEASLGFQYKF